MSARSAVAAILSSILVLACGSEKSSSGGPVTCNEPPACSADGYRVEKKCSDGHAEVVIDCLREHGQLCQNAACIDAWRYDAPTFGRCDGNPASTPETLAEKQRFYDDIAVRLHIHPKIKEEMAVVLKASATDPNQPAVSLETATYEDVEVWIDDNHNGIWSGFYLQSQAFRYAVTRDAKVLDVIRMLLDGDGERLRATGKPGVYARGVRYPDTIGHTCPTDDSAYTEAKPDKGDKAVAVRDDGCAWVIDAVTKHWKKTDHCGLEWLAGGCFMDDVSKDVTLGRVASLAITHALVDDPDVRATIADRLGQVGQMLVDNELTIVDWDDRITGSGKIYAMALDDFPGFNAAMALDYLVTTAAVSGKPELRDFYEKCLLQRDGGGQCLSWPFETGKAYTEYLPESHLFLQDCRDNFCSHSMQNLNLNQIIWFERDPEIREIAQRSFDVDTMRADQARAGLKQKNAWFDLMWAAHKRLGPDSDGPAFDAVEDAVCLLREFPARYTSRTMDRSKYTESCENRGGAPSGTEPLAIADRCPDYFEWWHSDPYELTNCVDSALLVNPPQGFLLPYWMGRYYGFITEDQ